MRIAVFGGSFNPPHNGHVRAALTATAALAAGRLIVIPAANPPHKAQAADTPPAEDRLTLTRLAFSGLENVEVSDIELRRGGLSYTVDTVSALKARYPGDELVLLAGTDMLATLEDWRDFRAILADAAFAAFPRRQGEEARIDSLAAHFSNAYGAGVYRIALVPEALTSTELRSLLKSRAGNNFLSAAVYNEIIRKRYYGAQPNLDWLRERAGAYLDEKRVPHVAGCEREAVRLARRWGADPGLAAEAGILHDITKKLKGPEQLILCEEYGIIADVDEKANYKLLHAKTGAAFARSHFGVGDEVYSAIFWHTTGRADMSLLDKIIYIADYIEPTRDFAGLDKLRALAYSDLDAALIQGLEMSIADLESRGGTPHVNSLAALQWLVEHKTI
ncbi:MAG: nicotinate (nicotinamide) nucleotide adenylyltransferase [Oscillospiraceae bacterium]|jgi:nicotinate-nucleotide adenylyltransferase|nr:nicotinate (nicotinamide) nucleotide adenylyltransferase [Oscillospiraceae bacterium]